MPLFLIHGFRWSRADIRIFTILNNLCDASPDYVMSASTPTRDVFLRTLAAKFPDLVPHLPRLTLVEQYDPDDLATATQPYAYVADKVIRADLCINVTDCMSQSLGVKAWDAMADLRDELAKDEKVGWWVVWNGDVDRDDLGPPETESDADRESIARTRDSGGGTSGHSSGQDRGSVNTKKIALTENHKVRSSCTLPPAGRKVCDRALSAVSSI